jgi:hypothetical protein
VGALRLDDLAPFFKPSLYFYFYTFSAQAFFLEGIGNRGARFVVLFGFAPFAVFFDYLSPL